MTAIIICFMVCLTVTAVAYRKELERKRRNMAAILYCRKYRQNNKEKIAKSRHLRYLRDRKAFLQLSEKDREEILRVKREKMRAYNALPSTKAKRRKRYAENREKNLAYQREYAKRLREAGIKKTKPTVKTEIYE